MANNLLTPLLQDGIRSSNFFNGRLLSAEDLNQEQAATLAWRKRLGRAIGEGIAHGLEVAAATGVTTKDSPVVTVQPGLAINRSGQALRLTAKTDVALVRPEDTSSASDSQSGFGDCTPVQPTYYVAGAGIYVLTIGPAKGTDGRAQVSGLRNDTVSCNAKDRIDGVQFRLIQLEFTSAELSTKALVRSVAARKCFGLDDLATFTGDPFGSRLTTYGPLDDLRPDDLTPCEVPLALLYWTQSGGIEFIDLWSVRRRSIDPSAVRRWGVVAADRRVAEAEAMFLQFQSHLEKLWEAAGSGSVPTAGQIAADQYFVYLPPAGYLPVGTGNFDWKMFLGPLAPPVETQVDEGLLRSIVHRAYFQGPVDIKSFSDWSKFSSSPPDPMHVYRIPGNDKFVLFARSTKGRMRVFLSATPTSAESVDIHAASDATDIQWNAAAGTGGLYTLDDLPSGSYDVDIAVQDYKPVATKTADAVDGRTTDLSVTLEHLPYGSLLVSIVDENGQSIGDKVSSVTVVSQQGSVSASGSRRTDNKWLINNLPPNSYTITAVAANYQTGTLSGVTVPLGQQVQQTITLIRKAAARPKLCILIKKVEKPLIAEARICLILGCPKSSGKATGSEIYMPTEEDMRSGGSWPEQNKKSKTPTDIPWKDFIQVDSLPTNVKQWLEDWKAWFTKEYPHMGIEHSTPMIFLDRRYAPPRKLSDVPAEPQGYAVFGMFGVPLSITPSSRMSGLPVRMEKKKPSGVSDEVLAALKKCGIIYVDQVPGLWTDFLQQVIDKTPIYWKQFVIDYITLVERLNKDKGYYDEMTPEVYQAIQKEGFTDDVALANANSDKLAGIKEVGDPGYAMRLIEEARQAVPVEAWALDDLGFTEGQIEVLNEKGIVSKGDLVASAGDPTTSGQIADTLGIPKESVTEFRSTAIGQMTKDSIQLAPPQEITMLSGVNFVVAEKMAEANILSVEDLSAKSPADVAKAANVSEEAATSMINAAKAASRGSQDVSLLAPVNTGEAAALKSSGITSVSILAGKSVNEIAPLMGNDVGKAQAILDAAKGALGGIGMGG
jgi:hypothetical protein